MAVGDVSCTLVGTYTTIALAVAAINGQNLPAATDTYNIFPMNVPNGSCFQVVKIVRATV